MSKPYAGIKDPVPQGTIRATPKQAIIAHQVRYYGIKQLPIRIIHEVQTKQRIEPMKVKLAIMHIKMKKQLQLYRHEPDAKKKEKAKIQAQKIAGEFEKLRKEIQEIEKKQ
jgi:LPS sulfotransferase NodH